MRNPILASFFVVLCVGTSVSAQAPVYVNAAAKGANNGTSWRDAFTDLERAMASASRAPRWVAQGTYRLKARGSSFTLKSGMQLYGGFRGTETRLGQRDAARNLTVLSGDVNGDDGPRYGNRRDNVGHVVVGRGLTGATLLDGFTVRGGSTIGNGSGGGMFLQDSSMRVVDCRITDNLASWGGGVSTRGAGRVVFERCRIDTNHVHLWRGAGLHAGTGSSVTLVDCEIRDNTIRAGPIHAHGAGVYGDVGSTLDIRGCRFFRNVINLLIGGRGAGPSGGAITFLGTGLRIDRSVFDSNSAASGGAIFTYSSMTITNSVFVHNRALRAFNLGGFGGAVVNVGRAVSSMRNCVVFGNRAIEDGGGILGNKLMTVVDSIVWGNRDRNGTVSESQIKGCKQRYCCIQNYLTSRPGEDPIDPRKFPGCTLKDPRFAGPNDFHVTLGSPCIDTGDRTSPGRGLDFFGNPRKLDANLDGTSRIDMGLHEFTNVRLAVAVRSVGSGARLSISTTGTMGLPTMLILGAPGRGIALQPFGELFVALPGPFLLQFLGTIPSATTLPLPRLGVPATLQALAFGKAGANLSNPVSVLLP